MSDAVNDPRPLHRIAVLVEAREDHDDPPWTDEDLLEAVQATLHEVFPIERPVVPTVTLVPDSAALVDAGRRLARSETALSVIRTVLDFYLEGNDVEALSNAVDEEVSRDF